MPRGMPSAVTCDPSSAGIATITINRAARRNAINPSTAKKLYTAFLEFEDDDTQKVSVFHGANGTFCAGADLQELATDGINKPVICAVSGYAVAGGLKLSLLGDMRVVEEDAVFGVFCRRFGVPLIDGGIVRLQAIVGLGRAMDMILTGRAVSAKEALSTGLANRVVPKGKALEEAMKIVGLLFDHGKEVIARERIDGARRFARGQGRSGKL
ncbi:enoyl coa-hydratase protein [Didymella exigua CBS 183.55]|uniref:Enoyl coa-hydratase protein n=1 Tax=Didymella exigua CBS 183.55 TaxID=1150837 RepID=A0A6A5RSK9_9PLEO|nr:enoyl coa-hydratase protein [Didymella exigua CBS 183.55]KAF1930589.1 enoyl coa-hydratase protein [Didymella exigua CBS 183.55]